MLVARIPPSYPPTSLRDSTRVAASNPAVWRDILLENRAHLLPLDRSPARAACAAPAVAGCQRCRGGAGGAAAGTELPPADRVMSPARAGCRLAAAGACDRRLRPVARAASGWRGGEAACAQWVLSCWRSCRRRPRRCCRSTSPGLRDSPWAKPVLAWAAERERTGEGGRQGRGFDELADVDRWLFARVGSCRQWARHAGAGPRALRPASGAGGVRGPASPSRARPGSPGRRARRTTSRRWPCWKRTR